MTIIDKTKPKNLVKIEDFRYGGFFFFTANSQELYRKVIFEITGDVQKMLNLDVIVQNVKTGSIVYAKAGTTVYEVEVTTTVEKIV
jgi:hypothetical protein